MEKYPELEKEIISEINYLKLHGNIIDYTKENVYIQLFGGSKYEYKTLQAVKNIISIIDNDIRPDLKKYITPDIYKYFDDYYPRVYKNEA